MRLALLPTSLALLCLAGQGIARDPGSYAPSVNQPCPDASLMLRKTSITNQTLNPDEIQYVDNRAKVLPAAWKDWIGDGSSIGYNLPTFTKLPKIGMAFSGGGYRAAQYGAGVIQALDIRNTSAKAAGTGGLFQVSSYISGLSGGSWLVTSLIFNNLPMIEDLVLGNADQKLPGWLLDLHLFLPGGPLPNFNKNQDFYGELLWGVMDKAKRGLDTSLTDIWTRALSHHFFNETTRENFFTNETAHGAGILWSDMPSTPMFQSFSMPYPFVVANSRPPDFAKTVTTDIKLPLTATVYEFSPHEMGSYDPSLTAFMSSKFLGTRLINGQPANSTACVTGFDQAGFVFGTSSSLFDQILNTGRKTIFGFDKGASDVLLGLLKRTLDAFSSRADDVANYPNPFQGINPGVFQDASRTWIDMVDGSTNRENVPLGPLMVKARGVDVILAVDASDDAGGWPSGRTLYATRNRTQTVLSGASQGFPPLPEVVADFAALGMNQRPTFLGCDPTASPPEYPLIVYLPNSPPADGSDPITNSDTFRLQYTWSYTNAFITASHNSTTSGFIPGQLGADPEFGTCFKCAAVDRARLTTTPVTPRSMICQKCFNRYCYDPKNPPLPGQVVGRKLIIVDNFGGGIFESFFEQHKTAIIVGSVFGLLFLIALFFGIFFFLKRGTQWWSNRKSQRLYRQVGSTGSDWSVTHHAPQYAQTYPPSMGPHQQPYAPSNTAFAGGAPNPYAGSYVPGEQGYGAAQSYEMGQTKDLGYTGSSHGHGESGLMTAGLEPVGSNSPSPPPGTGGEHSHPAPHAGQIPPAPAGHTERRQSASAHI